MALLLSYMYVHRFLDTARPKRLRLHALNTTLIYTAVDTEFIQCCFAQADHRPAFNHLLKVLSVQVWVFLRQENVSVALIKLRIATEHSSLQQPMAT